jgi:cell division protein FtsX
MHVLYHPTLHRRNDAMEKETSLEKLTVKELKEMALAMGGITGVTAMKKEELLTAIKEAKGIPIQKTREKPVDTIVEIKKKMRELRVKRAELREAGKVEKTGLLKKRLSRLKKKTRRLARKTAAAKTS